RRDTVAILEEDGSVPPDQQRPEGLVARLERFRRQRHTAAQIFEIGFTRHRFAQFPTRGLSGALYVATVATESCWSLRDAIFDTRPTVRSADSAPPLRQTMPRSKDAFAAAVLAECGASHPA